MSSANPMSFEQAPRLDSEAFARAFPFYIQVDPSLHVVGIGKSLEKLTGPIAAGSHFKTLFRVIRPIKAETFQDWESRIGDLWTLASLTGHTLTLRGSCEVGPGGTLLLLITPVLQSLIEEKQLGLGFADFAKHDASADALILAQTTHLSAADAKRISQRLRQRTEQLGSILELSNSGVIFFDASQQVLHVNSAMLEMLGMNRANALDMNLVHMDRWLDKHMTSGTGSPSPLRSLAQKESGTDNSLILHLDLHGRKVLRIDHAFTSEGGSVFYLRDITHETEVDRLKSEFLSSAAHELRTPMVSIFGFTELLLKRVHSPERQKDMLQTIHRQSGILVKMINELLDLARIEARRGLDLQIQPVSLRALIFDSVQGLMLPEGGRAVDVGTVPDVEVLADSEKMQLALANLLSNAFKYSPAGGNVELSAFTVTTDDTPCAVVQVRDKGIGMAPHEVARAFERFYRADTSGNIPGTGLGLCLVKEIAELHRGSTSIESTPGEGTTASLLIPLA